MSQVLVIAELNGQALNNSTARAVNCAAEINADNADGCDVAIFSDAPAAAAETATALSGVNKVLTITRPENSQAISAILAPQIAELAQRGYSHVLAPNTTFGKDLMPAVAALLDTCMVTDIMAVHNAYEFDRPIYAGNAVATVKAPQEHIVVATARCASWAPIAGGANTVVEAAEINAELPSHTRYLSLSSEQGDRPDLQSADKVVTGGRAVGSAENFKLIYDLADKIGAAVGASRAAVDSGYVANDLQVGQTGKIIAPELYICSGVSGAIQHIAGIKDAGTVVAINTDPDAAIFEVADIGLVADLFDAVPELSSKL